MKEILNKIFNEDCLDLMERLPLHFVDTVMTSPPYNTSRPGSALDKACANIRYDDYDDSKTEEEYIFWTLKIFKAFDLILKENGNVLYNMSYSSENTTLIWNVIAAIQQKTKFKVADCIVWKKPSTSPNSCSPNKLTRICEFVFVFCREEEIDTFYMNKGISSTRKTGQIAYKNIFNYVTAPNNDGPCDIHKATYSTELCAKLMSMYTPSGGVVFDPFMGTGTTALACIRYGFHYVGAEISKRYCEYADKRLSLEMKQLKLF